MKKMNLFLAFTAILVFVFTSCEDDNVAEGIYSNGAFIVNEGVYGKANASVCFYSFNSDSISGNIFGKANNWTIGDALQSIYNYQGKSYLIVNASNKIEVVNSLDFKQVKENDSVKNPRYMVAINGKGYVSQWGNDPKKPGSVAVIDLNTMEIKSTIAVGTGPEAIALIQGKIWVANCGGWVTDSTVMVIDPSTNKVEKTIVVGYNPQKVVEDKNGNVWVLCSGDFAGHASSLVRVSGSGLNIALSLAIGSFDHPMKLEISQNKQTVLYGGGFGFSGIWKVNIDATTLPDKAFIDGVFYSLSVNPNNDEIYAFDAIDYKSSGKMIRYKVDGTKIKEYTVGINPNSAAF